MRAMGRGTLLLVNGGSAVRPHPEYAGTSIAFAAESAYAAMLHDALAEENVHVAQLIIPGAIRPDVEHSSPPSWPSACMPCTPNATGSGTTPNPCPTDSREAPMTAATRRILLRAAPAAVLLALGACSNDSPDAPSPSISSPSAGRQETPASSSDRKTPMNIHVTLDGRTVDATLNDSPAARDLATFLPLTLELKDFHGTERVGYPPRKLTTDSAPERSAAKAGDLAYYAPWGNLALFYQDGPAASADLLILGHIDTDTGQLARADQITIEAAA